MAYFNGNVNAGNQDFSKEYLQLHKDNGTKIEAESRERRSIGNGQRSLPHLCKLSSRVRGRTPAQGRNFVPKSGGTNFRFVWKFWGGARSRSRRRGGRVRGGVSPSLLREGSGYGAVPPLQKYFRYLLSKRRILADT